MSHTPTPWIVRKERNDNEEEITTLYGKRQAIYAIGKPWIDVRIGELDDGETAPDVTFLLNAVNSHQAMKEALEGLLEHMWETEVNGIGIESPSDALEEAIKKAHKALILAKGKDKEP